MNKIFKVIWNYATQSWVAVSELQKAKGKTKFLSLGSNVVLQSFPMLKFSLISSGLLLASGQVIAATGTDNTAAGQCYYDTTTNSVICGDNKTKNNTTFTTSGASVTGNYSVAIGSEANTFNEGDIAIGRYAGQNRADKGSNFGGSGNVYSGGALISTPVETISTSHGVSIGRGAGMDSTGVQTTAIGYYAGRQHFGDNSITIGTFANNFLTNGLSDGKAVGNTIDALANNSKNVANIVNRSRDSIAIGYGAMTYDDEDVAIGKNAKTVGNNAMAIGTGARAGMAYTAMNGQSLTGATLAVGQGATAALGGDVSIGINAGSRVTQNATQLRNGVNLGESKNISLGNAVGNNVYGTGNLAFGVTAGGRVGTAEAININNVAFGNEVGNDVRGDNNIGIGWQTARRVRSNSNLAFGARSGNDINGADNIAVGFNAGNWVNGGGNWAAGYYAGQYIGVLQGAGSLNVANGSFATVSTTTPSGGNTAIGRQAGRYINGTDNIAIGKEAGQNIGHKITSFGSKSTDNIAIGATAGNFIEGNYNLAFGVNAGKGSSVDDMLFRTRSISQGYNATAYTNDSLAIGTNAKAGIQSTNGAGDVNAIAIGNSSTATKENSIAYGTKATATAKQAIAIGDTSTASGNTSVAIGPESKSQGWASVALGDYAQSSKNFAIAVGGWSKALGQDSIAFGRDTNASANESIAIGHESKVSGTKSTVIGIGNNVSGKNTFVLGNNVTATTNGSVVLGDEAATEGSHAIANVTNATVSGIYYGDFVGTVKDSGRFVSVGAKGDERKLINVAAGNISATSTEAINGSQLYLVTNTLRDQMPVVYTTTDGTKVTKQGDKFYKVNPDGSLGDEVPASNVIASMNNGNNSTTTPTTLTNVAGNLQGAKANTTAPTTSGTAPTPEEVANISNNAATVGDVLNAGWNLQENSTAKDFVKPYDTVNFVNGTGTIANVTTTNNGTINNVTFNVDTGSITPASNEDVKDKDDNVVIPSGEVSVADGQANKIATVQNVADAINSAGWLTNVGKAEGENANFFTTKAGEERKVSAGDKVIFQAGKNMEVKQDGVNVIYATSENVTFNTVQVGGENGPKITGEGNNIKIGDKDGNPTKITNVAAGEDDNDAVNVSQLNNAAAGAKTEVEAGDHISVNQTTGANGQTIYNVSVTTGNITKAESTGANAGKVTVSDTDKGKVATVDNVAEAINSAGWLTNVGKAEGENANFFTTKAGEERKVSAGDKVIFQAGKNMEVKQDGVNVIYATSENVTFNTVQVGGENGPKITGEGNNIKIGDKDGNPTKITNVAAGEDDNDAVNVSQLKKATTRVEGDQGVRVTPTPKADGSTTYTVEAKTDGTTIKIDSSGNITANTGTITPAPVNATDAAGNLLPNAGKVTVTGTPVGNETQEQANAREGNKLATVGDVANAINSAGWVVNTGKAADQTAFTTEAGTARKVSAGDKVNFQAGKNMEVKRDGDNIVYATSDNVSFNSVNVGNTNITTNGITINNGPSMTTEGIDAGNKVISRVAPGVKDNDAVNVSQLKGAVNNINSQLNKMDKRRKAGHASGLAVAGLMQAYREGQSAVTAGVGQYQNQSAVAVGYSRIADSGKYGVKAAFTANTQGEVGGTLSAGYFW